MGTCGLARALAPGQQLLKEVRGARLAHRLLIAAPEVIALAARVHESMCLSVNPWAQRIATRLLTDPGLSTWCEHNAQTLRERNLYALNALGPASGFAWNRTPRGGMFLFPEVSAIYQNLPAAYAGSDVSASDAVAKYLLQAHEIAVVPGDLYGQAGAGHIRLTNCGDGAVFQRAISRMAEIHKAIWRDAHPEPKKGFFAESTMTEKLDPRVFEIADCWLQATGYQPAFDAYNQRLQQIF